MDVIVGKQNCKLLVLKTLTKINQIISKSMRKYFNSRRIHWSAPWIWSRDLKYQSEAGKILYK